MSTLCLIVVGIAGLFCYSAPTRYSPEFGSCVDTGEKRLCYLSEDALPLRASWYNPELGGINCQEPCGQLGDGGAVADGFGKTIACPPDWYGREIDFGWIGSRQCRDSGEAIKPTCGFVFVPEVGSEYHCFITVDFLERTAPPFAYQFLTRAEPGAQFSLDEVR